MGVVSWSWGDILMAQYHEQQNVAQGKKTVKRSILRRVAKLCAWLFGGTLGVVVLALVIVLVGINTGAGKRLLERKITPLSGGMVTLSGLSGTLPLSVAFDHLDVRDTQGVWLALDHFDVHWSPLSLLHKTLHVDAVRIGQIQVRRAPVSDTTKVQAEQSASSSGGLPNWGVQLDQLAVDRIVLGAAFTGHEMAFDVHGHMRVDTLAPVGAGLSVQNLPDVDAGLKVTRLDAPGQVELTLGTPARQIKLHVNAHEEVGGALQTIAGLSVLEPLTVSVGLDGPRDAAVLETHAAAGPAQLDATGTLDLLANRLNLHVKGNAPAMTLRPGIGWNSIALDTVLHGPFKGPSGQGVLEVDALSAAGAGVDHLSMHFDGQENADQAQSFAHLTAHILGLRIPGADPTLLAGAPLDADVMAHPFAQGRPVDVHVTHPLFTVGVQAALDPAVQAHIVASLPDLAPLARLGHVDLAGKAGLEADLALPKTAQDDVHVQGQGTLDIAGGQPQALHLIGHDGRFAFDVSQSTARGVTLKHVGLDGRALHVLLDGALGADAAKTLNAHLALGLSDLGQAAPALHGHTDVKADVNGPLADFAVKAGLAGDIGANDVPVGPVALDVEAQHLPAHPQAHIVGHGTLDRAPFVLDTQVRRDDAGTFFVTLDRLGWNSVSGKGALRLPSGAKVPLGDLDLAVRNLADFRRITGQNIGGHVVLALHTTEAANAPARVTLGLDGALSAPQATVRTLTLNGFVDDPTGTPIPNLALNLVGLRVHQASGDMTGGLKATVQGPQTALDIKALGAFQNVMGAPASLNTVARLNVPDKSVQLMRLEALAKGERLAVSGTSLIRFGERMGVDHLHMTVAPAGVAPAVLDVRGEIKPRLALDATLDHLTPALAKPFAPDLNARGVISAKAHVTGTLAEPSGTVAVMAQGLHMATGPAASLPAANVQANAVLAGKTARIDTRFDAGSRIGLTANGTVPLSPTGALALATKGHVDLDIANAVLGAQGMETHGQVGLDMHIAGTAQQPRASGTVHVQNVSFNSYAQGVSLTGINGTVVAAGDTLNIQHILAHAGQGTIAVDGSVGVFRPGLPVELAIVSQNATPIASDLITATINTNLRIHGQAKTRLDVDGHIGLPAVTVNIPDSLPASVPQLDVIRPGQKVTQSTSALVIGLGIDVNSPGQFLVRGHGLDAEMAGNLHVGGVSTAPVVTGGFDLRRGNFNLAGINLTFTHGRVGFNGAGVNHRLDPTLDFRADRNAKGTLASLLVSGYASAPKLDFTSVPHQPRDEVLAILLFGTDSHSLSTMQLAELGAAVAQLAGGSSFDPMAKVRNALGLDRLAIGGGGGVNNGGTSVEAGKYVMKGVYVGAKQAMSGTGTQAQVQVDLTKRLKLNTTVGTGGQVTGFTTPENDPGSSVGLSYGYDY
ncbi:translocation/assembly module TamB domain-containing protein [Neokomagataea thailandica]|nr:MULTISPECIES: translocation/assembly module TamB domain-containing protein [Neokomagataea]